MKSFHNLIRSELKGITVSFVNLISRKKKSSVSVKGHKWKYGLLRRFGLKVQSKEVNFTKNSNEFHVKIVQSDWRSKDREFNGFQKKPVQCCSVGAKARFHVIFLTASNDVTSNWIQRDLISRKNYENLKIFKERYRKPKGRRFHKKFCLKE